MTQSPKRRISAPKPRARVVVILLSILFRLLLLGVGSGIAWVLGIAIAQVYPNPSSQMPLTEKLLRGSRNQDRPEKSLSSPSTLTPPSSPQIPLSTDQRQQLQTQLQQLQQEVNTLIGRTAALEIKLGISRPSESLEKRLQLIEQQLTLEVTNTPTSVAEPKNEPLSLNGSSTGLVVTLPSDILFESQTSRLRSGANVILDTILADLENYKGSAVRVAAHTDDSGQAQENLSLSLQQAETVAGYLSNAVVSSDYHWVAIGYGEGRPTAENDSDTNRQLNRRIEVSISP